MRDCCQGNEQLFSEEYAKGELRRFQKRGPARTTRMLIEALKQLNLQGLTLLDIGGGLGTIQQALLKAGVTRATDVDASSAYIRLASQEARQHGLADRIQFIHANFVDVAQEIPGADIVTLDRVICCYDDMRGLVSLSAAHADKYYALVYPRDTWWTALALRIENLFYQFTGSRYRAFVHSTEAVERLLDQAGLTRRFYRQTLAWQVAIFGR